jgi:hypothetical protein
MADRIRLEKLLRGRRWRFAHRMLRLPENPGQGEKFHVVEKKETSCFEERDDESSAGRADWNNGR